MAQVHKNGGRAAKLRLYWVAGRPNFGDTVTPELMSFLLGRDVVCVDKWRTQVLSIGSLLGWALFKDRKGGLKGVLDAGRMWVRRRITAPVHVWGTGFLYDPFAGGNPLLLRRVPIVHAVRGAKTRTALRRLGVLAAETPVALGDPGLLFGELWPDVRRNPRATSRAYVPHESEWGKPRLAAFQKKHPEIHLVDVRQGPKAVFAELADCGEVFSASLHGLIASDALGVPNRWVRLDVEGHLPEESRYKFDDYYSAYGEVRDPIELEAVPSAEIGPQIPAAQIEAVRDGLRKSCARLRAALCVA